MKFNVSNEIMFWWVTKYLYVNTKYFNASFSLNLTKYIPFLKRYGELKSITFQFHMFSDQNLSSSEVFDYYNDYYKLFKKEKRKKILPSENSSKTPINHPECWHGRSEAFHCYPMIHSWIELLLLSIHHILWIFNQTLSLSKVA